MSAPLLFDPPAHSLTIMASQLLWSQVIEGQPCSKSNSRQLVQRPAKGATYNRETKRFDRYRPMLIKSEVALQYETDFLKQARTPAVPIQGKIILSCRLYYASHLPDLDCSLIQDCLQKAGVIENDRQICGIILESGIDKVSPRAEIEIWSRG